MHLSRYFVLLTLVVLTWVPFGRAAAPAGGGGGGTYTDPANGFSLSPPAFGEAKQERVIITIFQAPPEADGYTPNVTVGVDPVKTTLKAYVQDTSDTMAKTNPKATIRSVRTLTVSGKEAEILEYDANMAGGGGRRVRFMQLFVVTEDRVYVVTCTAPVDTFPQYQPQFEKCVASFSLTHG